MLRQFFEAQMLLQKLMGKIIQKSLMFAKFMKQFNIKLGIIIWTYQMNFQN